MDFRLPPRQFLRVWNTSDSPTEASVRLAHLGFAGLEPGTCVLIALSLMACGYNAKLMVGSDLPAYQDPDADLPAPRPGPNPGLAAPDAVVECEVAAKHAAFGRWQREADPAFTSWYMQNQWAFRPGSND